MLAGQNLAATSEPLGVSSCDTGAIQTLELHLPSLIEMKLSSLVTRLIQKLVWDLFIS